MKCPLCPDTILAMVHRQGVEIDGCPTCRGVWLDRGELDKLLERAAASAETTGSPRQVYPDFADSDFQGGSRQHPRRRRSWLDDIFD